MCYPNFNFSIQEDKVLSAFCRSFLKKFLPPKFFLASFCPPTFDDVAVSEPRLGTLHLFLTPVIVRLEFTDFKRLVDVLKH